MNGLFEQIFDKSPIIQVVTDEHNVILYVNQKFENYFGYSNIDVEGKHISTLLAEPKDVDVVRQQNNEYPNVWEVVTKKGEHRFIAIETSNIKGKHLITAYDLTKEAFRARNNSLNVNELKKYLISSQTYE